MCTNMKHFRIILNEFPIWASDKVRSLHKTVSFRLKSLWWGVCLCVKGYFRQSTRARKTRWGTDGIHEGQRLTRSRCLCLDTGDGRSSAGRGDRGYSVYRSSHLSVGGSQKFVSVGLHSSHQRPWRWCGPGIGWCPVDSWVWHDTARIARWRSDQRNPWGTQTSMWRQCWCCYMVVESADILEIVIDIIDSLEW